MKIVELRTQNVKRLSAVQIKPDGAVVVIGGDNGQGKSSVLDSILYGLGGAGTLPGVPVRNGQKSAEIEIAIDSEPPIRVKRKIASDGKTTLEIKQVAANGVSSKVTSPQKLLDSLCGKIAFDPLAFTRLRPQEQATLLREVVGIDLSDIDAEYQQVFEHRTGINREVKRLESELLDATHHDDVPETLVDTAALMQQLDEVSRANKHYDESLENINACEKEAERWNQDIGDCSHALEQLRAKFKEAEREAKQELENAKAKHAEAEQNVIAAREIAEDLSRLDDSELRQQIASADTTNEKIRANFRYEQTAESLRESQATAEEDTKRLDRLKADRIERMHTATWPVEGLGFTDAGVSFQGLPFDQCSSAEQLRISTAIGLAQHPQLKVLLIRDGSLLDSESLAMIGTLAEEHDAQIWIERVGHGEECSVVIDDGAIAATPAQEPALSAG